MLENRGSKRKALLKNINLQHIEINNGQVFYGHKSAYQTITD